jgi:hypothetical protein
MTRQNVAKLAAEGCNDGCAMWTMSPPVGAAIWLTLVVVGVALLSCRCRHCRGWIQIRAPWSHPCWRKTDGGSREFSGLCGDDIAIA